MKTLYQVPATDIVPSVSHTLLAGSPVTNLEVLDENAKNGEHGLAKKRRPMSADDDNDITLQHYSIWEKDW